MNINERLNELVGSQNKQGKPLIEWIEIVEDKEEEMISIIKSSDAYLKAQFICSALLSVSEAPSKEPEMTKYSNWQLLKMYSDQVGLQVNSQ